MFCVDQYIVQFVIYSFLSDLLHELEICNYSKH